MRKILVLLLLTIVLVSCSNKEKIDFEYVAYKFEKHSNDIKKIEYNAQRIDTFPNGGVVWNNKGYALIEKNKDDNVFGFSFYAKRDDVPKTYIYDKGNGFDISKEDKSYEVENGHFGFIGTPGGQMISRHIFYLDSIYKSAELFKKKDRYILRYEFEDDTIYGISNITKTIELDKNTFLPVKVTRMSKQLGNKAVSQIIITNAKINNDVNTSVASYKEEIRDYKIIQQTKRQVNKVLGQKFPEISLPNLLNQSDVLSLKPDKLTLLDFWEVWCGPCITSFPKVEKIKNKYAEDLQVVGIVSEDKENAIKLINEKGTTFMNLLGTKDLLKKYSVNSYPRYFLIDKEGIIQKEYHGFSEQIEKDIINMLSK